MSASRLGEPVLDSITVEIDREITALVGPSGSGKSTLLRLLNRLADPDSGSIYFEDKPLDEWDVLQLRRKAAYVPQLPALFDGTAAENIRYGTDLIGERPDTSKLLEMVSLDTSFSDRRADKLSVGEQQRLMLARALALDPDVLLLDEPTSALDPDTTRNIEATLLDLSSRLKLPMVLVTHDHDQAERVANRILTLADGRITSEPGHRS